MSLLSIYEYLTSWKKSEKKKLTGLRYEWNADFVT